MKFFTAGLTDVGLQREVNEDNFCIEPEHQLFVVADGMGGHRAGHVASRMAATLVASFFEASRSDESTWPFTFDPTLSTDENRLVGGIKFANRQIFETSVKNSDVRGMGTTVVGVLYSPTQGKLFIAHVGDSRAYRLRDGEIVQLTRDHSLLNDYLALMPDLPAAQRQELPRNVITRALGMQDTVQVDLLPESPQHGDRYVLCTDGLTGMLSDAEIRDIVVEQGENLEAAVKSLVLHANEKGGEDNITVVLVKVEGSDVSRGTSSKTE